MAVLVQASAESLPADTTQDWLFSAAVAGVALTVWLVERQLAGTPSVFFNELRRLAPELLALTFCLLLASGLIFCGQHNGGEAIPKQDEGLWKDINAEWPILKTADTLLGLQAMLRLVLLSSAVLRGGDQKDSSAFALEPATFMLAAAVTRAVLLLLSPWDVYHLDGPLGGALNLGAELVAVPLLIWLARGMLSAGWARLASLAIASTAVLAVALSQRLALADPGSEYLDVLFSFSMLLDLAGAAWFLIRCCALGSNARSSFMAYAVFALPAQELLVAIFMLSSWGEAPFQEVTALVGSGRPFLVLQASAIAEVGLYLASAVVFTASVQFAKDDEERATPLFAQL
ncbi:HERC1 [Symbiodinium sp. CCMP2592]|nr:HERC1 [Symbiodinium sp. CCMP2592]